MSNGYIGKILWVDLYNNKIEDERLDEELCRDYFGGYGLGSKILFDRQKAGVNPLGPENILGFVTGTFTGTAVLGGSRYTAVGKSPLTCTWGDSNSGGYFGPHLKFAGYDAVFFTGISSKPVYLFINNGKPEIRDAAHLWGKDTHETEDILKNELGKDIEVACIGPSGEKISLIAAIITDKGRAAGRSGLGAVMGSKKLKAVAVKGNIKIPVFDENKVDKLRKTYMTKLTGFVDGYKKYGTPTVVVPFAKIGDAPTKNWSGVCDIDFPDIENLGVDAVMSQQEKKYGCYRCTVACGGIMKESHGEYQYPAGVHKPEYETMSMFGANCLNGNLKSIIKANDICNRYGLDTISAGATISFAIECYENGLITRKDTDGIEMTWGNHKSIIAMLEKLAKREGFGDVLADGTKVASEKIDKDAFKYAIHIQGQELPAHDPKLEYGFASCYRMDATPARHGRWHGNFVPPGVPRSEYTPRTWTGRGEHQKTNVIFNHALDGLGACLFFISFYPHVNVMIDFLNAVTGWDMTPDNVLKVGERIANVRQAFNIREGLNPLKYKIAGRIVGKPPMKEGPLAGVTINEEEIDREFLVAMDWDLATTKPSKKKLSELGLDDVAKMLWH